MIDRLIENTMQLDRLIRLISRQRLPFRCSIVDGRARSYDQNKLMWQWAAEIAAHENDQTPREVQHELKLRFGVPLLVLEDARFALVWAGVERTHNYTQRLALMEYFDVTSKLSVKGFAEFLNQIEREYAHVELTIPEDRRYGPAQGTRVDRGNTGQPDPEKREASDRAASELPVRGLYAGLQREAPAADGSSPSPREWWRERGEQD